MQIGAPDLPDDVAALKALLIAGRAQYSRDIAVRDKEISVRDAKIAALDGKIGLQAETIDALQANLDKLRQTV